MIEGRHKVTFWKNELIALAVWIMYLKHMHQSNSGWYYCLTCRSNVGQYTRQYWTDISTVYQWTCWPTLAASWLTCTSDKTLSAHDQYFTDTQLTLSWYLILTRLTLLSLGGLLLLSSIFFTSPSKLFFVSPLHNGKEIRDGCHSSKTTVNNTHIPPTVHHAIQCCMLDWYAANCWSQCNSQSLAKCWPSCQPSIKQL